MISTIVLAAGVAILLLLIGVGLVVIVLSDRAERRDIVMGIAIVGLILLLLLCCIGAAVGLAWFFFGATVTAPPPPVYPTPLPVRPMPIAPPAPPASVSLIPGDVTVAQGESISVTIHIADAADLYGVEVHLTYGDGLSAGGLVPGTCASDFIAQSQTGDGQIDFAASRMGPKPALTGDCDVATFTLTGETPGIHAITFDSVILASREGDALPATTRDASITVESPTP